MDNTKNCVDVSVIKQIYCHLGDEISKSIFINRLLYTLTNDLEYMRKVIYTTNEGEKIKDSIDSNKKIVLFGAGAWGKLIADTFSGFVECFIDNMPKERFYANIPVISFGEYIKRQNNQDMIVITTSRYQEEIYKQLLDAGIRKGNIINAGLMILKLSVQQYFDLPVLQYNACGLYGKTGEGAFVDAGSLNGKTSVNYMDWCRGNYDKIWAFEPDEVSCNVCERTLADSGCKNFEVIPKALWNEECTLNFSIRPGGASTIVDNSKGENAEGTIKSIEATNLDSVIHDKVTFIKMDIEGAEYNALMGSRRIITEYRPALAISVYHKPEDIWTIPELICNMNPDYTLYLRHYTVGSTETVLYAV